MMFCVQYHVNVVQDCSVQYSTQYRRGVARDLIPSLSCVVTVTEDARVSATMSLDTILMWDFFLLAEMESWSVFCQGCQIIKQKLSEAERLQTCSGDIFESLELTERGLVFRPERRVVTSIRGHLPTRMRPMLELFPENLGQVSLFSLARVILPDIDNVPCMSSVMETCLQVIISIKYLMAHNFGLEAPI